MSRYLDPAALVLTSVGALNWGLVSLFKFDLVAALAGLSFGQVNVFSRVVYGLVGLAGLYLISLLPRLAARPAVAQKRYAS